MPSALLESIGPRRRFAWMAAALLGLWPWSGTVSAQQVRRPPPASTPNPDKKAETPTEPTTKPVAEQAPRLFGDPKKFNQFSGWGGIGGAMGQFGFAKSMLVMMPAVQAELGITEDQKLQLREWSEIMRERGQEMTQGMRDQAEGDARENRFQVANILGMMNTMQVLMKENEEGFGKILTADQRKRLLQISLQMEGITALARSEVAQAIHLHPEQIELIQQVLAQARTKQVFYWMSQGRQMWAERSRDRQASQVGREEGKVSADEAPGETPPSRPSPPRSSRRGEPSNAAKPTPAATDPPASSSKPKDEVPSGEEDEDESPEARAARQAEREQQALVAKQRFEKMRTGADQIQDETVSRILKVLTRGQRSKYEKLLGPPFDPDAVFKGLNDRSERGTDRASVAGQKPESAETAPNAP